MEYVLPLLYSSQALTSRQRNVSKKRTFELWIIHSSIVLKTFQLACAPVFLLTGLSLFKRTACCPLSLPHSVSSGKLIQSSCVILAKFPISAREWLRRKRNVLEASQFHDGSRNFLDLPYRKIYRPGIIAVEWYVRTKNRICIPSSRTWMLQCARRICRNECPFMRKNNIGMHNFPAIHYIHVRIIAIDWYQKSNRWRIK